MSDAPAPDIAPVPIPQRQPEPTFFDRAIQKLNEQVGTMNFQMLLMGEQLADKDRELAEREDKIRALEAALAPFLGDEPKSEAGASAGDGEAPAPPGPTPIDKKRAAAGAAKE